MRLAVFSLRPHMIPAEPVSARISSSLGHQSYWVRAMSMTIFKFNWLFTDCMPKYSPILRYWRLGCRHVKSEWHTVQSVTAASACLWSRRPPVIDYLTVSVKAFQPSYRHWREQGTQRKQGAFSEPILNFHKILNFPPVLAGNTYKNSKELKTITGSQN